MSLIKSPIYNESSAVNLAFSKQAAHFDADDLNNPILQRWRKQIHAHVELFLKRDDSMLELNAGTGIDAFHFAKRCRAVLATDVSNGMAKEMEKKISQTRATNISFRQLSFTNLRELGSQQFDYVFSNFGGLNCIQNLSAVTIQLSERLRPGAHVTWVLMPRFCPWELLWILKGKWREATRRFRKGGASAHLEGTHFQTHYHSLSDVKTSLGPSFELVSCGGLGIFSAPPGSTSFYHNYPVLYQVGRKIDLLLGTIFPFSRWGDHIIVTFRKSTKG